MALNKTKNLGRQTPEDLFSYVCMLYHKSDHILMILKSQE